MTECTTCGVTLHDLPFEELGLSEEDAADTLFEYIEGETYCQGCASLHVLSGIVHRSTEEDQ